MVDINDNQAAWLTKERSSQLEVGPGPDQSEPIDNEVVVKVEAWGIIPVDGKLQHLAIIPLSYPKVPGGGEIAGTVVKTGPKVTRFVPGDRVMAQSMGLVNNRNAGFQRFVAAYEPVVAKIPGTVSWEEGAILPSSLSTACDALFKELKLKAPAKNSTRKNQIILVWGGASSVGSAAIQLATAAGYDVVSTSSPKNFDLVKSLARSSQSVKVLDYHDADVVDKLIKAIKESAFSFAGGFDSIGIESSVRASASVVHAINGGGPLPITLPPPDGLPQGIKPYFVQGGSPAMTVDHPAAAVWRDFVPDALESGLLKPLPPPTILAGGLPRLQEGVNLAFKGVSATKIVVTA